jgi:hypothetical protein
MKLENVGEIIAERKLTQLHDDGPPTELVVLLGKPKQTPGYEDYYCPYQINGAGDRKVWYSCGIDAFQALQLTIRSIGVELEVLNKRLGGKLRWEGDDKGWLGIPDPPDHGR